MQQKTQTNQWLTPAEFAAEFQLPQTELRRMARDGLIPKPLVIGPRLTRYSRADVDAWAQSRFAVAVGKE